MVSINLIIESFDKNFFLVRTNGLPRQPMVANDYQQNYVTPIVKCDYTHDGKTKHDSFRLEIPRILACLMAELQGIPRNDSILVFNIEKEETYMRYLSIARAILKKAVLGKKVRSVYKSIHEMPEEELDWYRVYLKWHLCLNYIRLHKPDEWFKEEQIFDW